MPKITVTEPFNYSAGGVTKHYPKGTQEVPESVAAHAWDKDFASQPKAPAPAAGKTETPAAE